MANLIYIKLQSISVLSSPCQTRNCPDAVNVVSNLLLGDRSDYPATSVLVLFILASC